MRLSQEAVCYQEAGFYGTPSRQSGSTCPPTGDSRDPKTPTRNEGAPMNGQTSAVLFSGRVTADGELNGHPR